MLPTPKRLAAVVAVMGVLAIGGPLAGATAAPAAAAAVPGSPGFNPALCSSTPVQGQGTVAGTEIKICQGSGLVFVAPSVGQVASVIGPTIIGPAVLGASGVAAGNAAVG
jgi:hypothetical protein